MSPSESLTQVLPAEALEVESPGEQEDFSEWGSRAPESVVRPGSTPEVARLMAWASREGVGILPLGSRGRGGYALPNRPARDGRYVVLSTERLSGISIYEPADLTLTAGAGTPLREVDAALREHAQWAPFDPPFVLQWTLGGLAANGSSGPLGTGYGELRNHVLGMTIVTGDGRTIELGGRVVKNVAGFDLLKAMVGSQGILSVITSVCLRTFPIPAVDRALILEGEDLGKLVEAAQRVGTAPILPASIVLTDRVPGPSGCAALVVRLHGARTTVAADQASLELHLGTPLAPLGGASVGEGSDGEGSGADRDAVLVALRDRGADASACIVASALPSRLGDLVVAVESLQPDSVVVDCYAGVARVGGESFSADAVVEARGAIERIGGALRVVRWPRAASEPPASSGLSPDEVELTAGLRRAFDPAGVLWPARR